MTPQDLEQIRVVVRQEIEAVVTSARSAVVPTTVETSQFRRVDYREGRMDRLDDTTAALNMQMVAFNNWANRLDRSNTDLLKMQIAQQRAIDDLQKRLSRPPG